jgi:hypothetical protein
MSVGNRDENAVRELVALSEDELYRRIAADTLGRQSLPVDPRDLLDRGQRIFQAQSAKVRGAICSNPRLKSFASGTHDVAEIAIEILKVVSALVVAVSPITLCVLLAKKGLKNLCQSEWGKDDT